MSSSTPRPSLVPIRYSVGDATDPAPRPAVIANLCNDLGAWGRGFVLAVSRRWPHVAREYRAWLQSLQSRQVTPLGHVQFLRLASDLWIANMIAQHGIRSTSAGSPIRYDAVTQCLWTLERFARQTQASVHMPRIGCGLAGGAWDRIEPVIRDTLSAHGVAVTVYDLRRRTP
jgi:O-acetyl-ADP-ribose deacetylase (regulator of RNase III)